MRRIALVLIVIGLTVPSLALTEYQRGVLDGLKQGWSMAQMYDQARGGDIASYNQAVLKYNAWIESIFGENESLMLKISLNQSLALALQHQQDLYACALNRCKLEPDAKDIL